MKRKFKRIEIGERFLYNGKIFSKTQDGISGIPLNKQPPNAINLKNGHTVVFGEDIEVDLLLDEMEEDKILYDL